MSALFMLLLTSSAMPHTHTLAQWMNFQLLLTSHKLVLFFPKTLLQ